MMLRRLIQELDGLIQEDERGELAARSYCDLSALHRRLVLALPLVEDAKIVASARGR